MIILEIQESEEDVYTACEAIDEHCIEFIKDMKTANKFLYRGIDYRVTTPIFTDESPATRSPIGQTRENHKKLNILLTMGGFKALRSNSICCSSNLKEATGFGAPFMIFPANGYEFTWSSRIDDIGGSYPLMHALNDWDLRKKLPVFGYKPKKWPPAPEEAEAFLDSFGFQDFDMVAALNSGNEIAIHGKYMAISRYYIDIVSKYFGVIEGS